MTPSDGRVFLETIELRRLDALSEVSDFNLHGGGAGCESYKACYCLTYSDTDFCSASYVADDEAVDRLFGKINGDDRMKCFCFQFDDDSSIAASPMFAKLIKGIVSNRPSLTELRLVDIGSRSMQKLADIIIGTENITIDTLMFGVSGGFGFPDAVRSARAMDRPFLFGDEGCDALFRLLCAENRGWLRHLHITDYSMPARFFVRFSSIIRGCSLESCHLYRCCYDEVSFGRVMAAVRDNKTVTDFGFDLLPSYSSDVVSRISDMVKKNGTLVRLVIAGSACSAVYSNYGCVIDTLRTFNSSLTSVTLASASSDDDFRLWRCCYENARLADFISFCLSSRGDSCVKTFPIGCWPYAAAVLSCKADHLFRLVRSDDSVVSCAGVGYSKKRPAVGE